MSFVLEHMRNNLWRGKFSSFPEDLCVHGLTGRLGGVSQKPYDSLNMALHVGDNPADVWENRFLHALGLKAEDMVTPEQVHGQHIVRVGRAEAGRGAKEYEDSIPETDALITDEPGLPLVLCFADCTPVLFLDPEHLAVGIAHGGWKGTVKKIAQKTVMAMTKEFGTKPSDVLAAIGPAIGPCCYEVGDEVAARQTLCIVEAMKLMNEIPSPDMDIGVKSENIDMADTCTACKHQWFYSYRADGGTTGRMAAVIALNKY